MHSAHIVVFIASCWLGRLPSSNAANNFQTYPVDWASAGNATTADTNLTSGCICALLSRTCTPNCCCDPACPASAVQEFRAADSCLPEGPPPEQLAYCTPDEPFAKVNLPAGDFYRISKAPANGDFITQLLCIAADHNPSLGLSYPDPPAGDVGTNAQQTACPATVPATVAATASYSYGQPVIVSAPSATAAGGRVRAPLTLPVAALSAECMDMQQVGWLNKIPASLKESVSTCQRTISTAAALTALCNNANSPLSPTYYSGMRFPPTPAATTLKAINVTALRRVTAATGALTALNPTADLADPTAVAGPPVACTGVVLEVNFLFRYDDSTSSGSSSSNNNSSGLQLVASEVELVIGDVAMPSAGSLAIQQRFSVSWANVTAAETALLPLSGAPGYLPGFPLLAGVAASSTAADGSTEKAVARFTAGFTLPGASAAGRCSGNTGDAVNVDFGYNTSSSCGVSLTRAQLKTFCTANDAGQTLTNLLGGWLTDLTSKQVMLGVWGNSDPTNINQWTTLQSSSWPPGVKLEWDEATSTCSNVVTGFDLNILTGVAWASGNLQSKVLYGQMCFRYGSWQFNEMTGPALQSFPLQFTASFVPKDQQQPSLQLKPAPPLAVPLPPDLFYPFMTSAAVQHAVSGLHVGLLLAAVWAALLLYGNIA